jgi:hypothetical protein
LHTGYSLDEQYQHFNARSQSVFDQYPQIQPMRVSIFKDLLVGRHGAGVKDSIKHWARPFFRWKKSDECSGPVDVLLFMEGQRDVIVNALLPVHAELNTRGVRAALVSFRGPGTLPSGAIQFRFRAAAVPPSWASDSWELLSAAVEGLRDASLKRSYFHQCAITEVMIDECQRIVSMLDPKIVLTASNPMEGGLAMTVAAQARGAEAVQMQHGMLQPFYVPVVADHMLTWGNTSSQVLERMAVPSDKLRAIGSPRHDTMKPQLDGRNRALLLETLQLPDRPTLVFFSNGNDLVRNGVAPAECAAWLESVAAEYVDSLNVVVRLHPNEDGALYHCCQHLLITKSETSLETILDGCDLVGSLCSTVLYDALLYQKPTWQFWADGWPELADNWKYGLSGRISSKDHLKETIGALLRGGSTDVRKDLCEQVFANHGRAARAVADFVEQRL